MISRRCLKPVDFKLTKDIETTLQQSYHSNIALKISLWDLRPELGGCTPGSTVSSGLTENSYLAFRLRRMLEAFLADVILVRIKYCPQMLMLYQVKRVIDEQLNRVRHVVLIQRFYWQSNKLTVKLLSALSNNMLGSVNR